MNATAPNLAIVPASTPDRTPRSGSAPYAKPDSHGPVSFADSLHSARTSDANNATTPKAKPEKSGSTGITAPLPAKTNTPAKAVATGSNTNAADSTTANSTTNTAVPAETQPATDALPNSAQGDAGNINPQQPAIAAPANGQAAAASQEEVAAGSETDGNAGQPVDAAKPAVSGGSHTDTKTSKKHAAEVGGQLAVANAASSNQASTVVAVSLPVPFVMATPAVTTNQTAADSKSLPNVIGTASKDMNANVAAAAAPQNAAQAANAVGAPQANTDVSPDVAVTEESSDRGSSFADKIVAATQQHVSFPGKGEGESVQQGATFSYSLNNMASLHHNGNDIAKASDIKTASAVDEVSKPQFTPVVRRLEVAVNDPVLGNVDVRAEMRGGNLHASIAGVSASSSAVPDLHQFLQQHQVEVHSISFNSTADAVRAAAPSSSSSFSSNDANAQGNPHGNAQYSGSGASQQQNRESSSQNDSAVGGYLEDAGYASVSNRYASSRVPVSMLPQRPSGSTLSIHI